LLFRQIEEIEKAFVHKLTLEHLKFNKTTDLILKQKRVWKPFDIT
jgi:hypothetical protein